nr:NADH dehydrogenase subunit 2 [Ixodes acutitarsus]
MFFQKMIFIWLLMMSIFMAVSSSYWFALWMSLEMNMMIFIPMMNSKNFLSSNSMLYYFIIQSLASSLFFFASLLSPMFFTKIFNLVIMISMLMKLGSAPFHIWFPQISEGLSYNSFFFLSSFQKIIPFYIMTIISKKFLILFIILSAMMGSFGGLNQKSFKKILAFSSISHISWMLSLILISHNFWMMYFFIYILILMKIIYLLKKNNIMSIININSIKFSNFKKMYLFSLFLSLGGLPPFLGFLTKWISIILIIKNFPLILMFLISSSLINLYFYIRSLFPLIMNMNIFMKFPLFISSPTFMNFFMINFMSIMTITPFIILF